MGRWVICLLTAASVFWHTVAGCCAHHAHASVAGSASPQAEGVTPEHRAAGGRCSHGCRHRSSHCGADKHRVHSGAAEGKERSNAPSCPCDERGSCRHTRCAFVLEKPASLPDLDESSSSLTVAVAIVAMTGAELSAGQLVRDHGAAVWRPVSLRAHLYLCVLNN